MTIDEAILHAEEVAEENQSIVDGCDYFGENMAKCEKCAEEHRQLVEWLKDYKRLKEQEPKTGHWIRGKYTEDDIRYNDNSYKCSECGRVVDFKENFCPRCGVKMVEPRESEEA